MKRLLIIWAIFTGLCLAYLYPYRKEIGLYWREWSSFQRHFVCNDKGWNLRRPFLSETVAQQDPEAAAIVELICRDYRGDSHRSESKDIDDLSNLSLKYPDNPYFLYDLACRLTSRTYIDPQIINSIADRLLRLDPNNGRYYSLKAWTAFYDWDDNRAEKALEYLEKCFSSPNTQDPYELYKARVCGLMEKEKPTSLISNWPATWHTNDYLLSRNVVKDLLVYTQDLIVNSESEKAMQIHDQLQRLAEKSVPQKIEFPWQCFWLSFRVNYMMRPGTPQTVELKWMNLEPQRAKQNRMQMLAWKQLVEKTAVHKMPKVLPAVPSKQEPQWWTLSKLPLAAHCFQMTLTSMIVMSVFLAIGLILKMRQSRLSRVTLAGMILFSLLYFIICRWSDYGWIYDSGDWPCTYNVSYGPVSYVIFEILGWYKPYAQYGLLAVALILGIFAAILMKRHTTPNLFGRIVFRLLCFLFVLSLWMTATSMQYGSLVFDLLVLLFIIPVLGIPIRDIKGKAYYGLFSQSEEGMRYRYRCVVLYSYVVLLNFIVFTLFASTLADSTYQIDQEQKGEIAWQPVYPPRFAIDPNSYQTLLAQFETQDPSKINLSEWLPMVDPADIPKVLTVLKERREKDPNSRLVPGMGAPVPLGEKGFVDYNREYQSDLLRAMDYCGKDVLPYVLPFFKYPNSENVLVLQGRFGDTAVREQLVQLWRQKFDSWKPANNSDALEELIGQRYFLEALVTVCPFLESKQYLIEHNSRLLKYTQYDWPDTDVMKYLSREQKGEIINTVIPLLKEKPPLADCGLDWLQYNAELNTVSQEWLWKRLIDCGNNQDKRYSLDDLNLENKPSDYHISDGLLAGCLNNQNERLRAMRQHIYRKLGKPLDEQILQRWAGDSNFIIRADVALLRPGKIPASDPSAFVRLVQRLAKQNETGERK